MLKWLVSIALACCAVLPCGVKAEDVTDPFDIFAVLAAEAIKQNERLFMEASGGFSLLGANILRSSFISSCAKMTGVKYLSDMSQYKELDEDRQNFCRPAAVRYDSMANHLSEFLFKVGKQVSTAEFKNAKQEVSAFSTTSDAQSILTRAKQLAERDKKYRAIAARMRKDFDDIASHKNDSSFDKLQDSNAMKKYFKNNPKKWPLKKNDLRTMDIPDIYGMTDYYKQDMFLKDNARRELQGFDDLFKKLKPLPKHVSYLEQTYASWKKFLAQSAQYRDKVREIAVHPRAKLYFMPQFTAAMTEAYQKNKQYADDLIRDIDTRGIPEVQAAKRLITQEPLVTMTRNSGSYEQVWASGRANTLLSSYEMLQPWVEGYLCSKACK